jgi:hypothetical protein
MAGPDRIRKKHRANTLGSSAASPNLSKRGRATSISNSETTDDSAKRLQQTAPAEDSLNTKSVPRPGPSSKMPTQNLRLPADTPPVGMMQYQLPKKRGGEKPVGAGTRADQGIRREQRATSASIRQTANTTPTNGQIRQSRGVTTSSSARTSSDSLQMPNDLVRLT